MMLYCSNCGRECQPTGLVPICSVCEKEGFLRNLSQRFYSYERKDGTQLTERRSEILRKIGQNRLSFEMAIVEGDDRIPLAEHIAFRSIFMPNSSEYREIQSRRAVKTTTIKAVSNRRRNSFVVAFVVMLISLGIGKFGYDNDWFVVEYDPFVNTDPQVPSIPESLQDNILRFAASPDLSVSLQETTSILVQSNPKRLEGLSVSLAKELSERPFQGDLVLEYLQAQLQFLEVQNDTWEIWYRWAVLLPHDESLANRVKAMLLFRRGDAESLAKSLETCVDDEFCDGLRTFLDPNGTLPESSNGYVWRLMMEKALLEERAEWYAAIGEQLLKIAPEKYWGDALIADDSLLRGDTVMAFNMLQNAFRKDDTNASVLLWMVRALLLQGRSDVRIPSNAVAFNDETQFALAALAFAQGNKETFFDLVRTIKDADLQDQAALLKADMHLQNRDEESARKELMSINKRFDNIHFRFYQGVIWASMGDLRSAATIMDEFEASLPHKWFLNLLMSIASQNVPLMEQALDRLAFSDVELLTVRDWETIWVPQMNRENVLRQGTELLQSTTNAEKYITMLEWICRPVSSKKFLGLSSSDAAVQMMYAQSLMLEEKWMMAIQKIQRASTLAPNEASALILQQVINAGIGRQKIAQRELGLLATKEDSRAYNRWFWKGFILADDADLGQKYKNLVYKPYPKIISTNEYILQWKE